MKKLIVLIVVCLVSALSFAQKAATVSSESLSTGKQTGTYVFIMPADISNAQIEGVKGYYKDYFTTKFDEKKHELTFVLSKNEETNKRVMNRMMVALEIRTFNVGTVVMTFDDLFEKYLR